jgi:hypothetical protein
MALSTEVNTIPGVRRVKLRYGPYRVPNMNKSSITGEMGMLWNYPDVKIEKPCSTTCVIIRQWAGLEFPDGRNANIDNGMWLHHMVALLIGPNRWDPTCYGKGMSLPHFDVNSSPQASERYFSSGNERTRIELDTMGLRSKTDVKWGIQMRTQDRIGFIVDLMNMNPTDQVVYMTMYYDYLPGNLPAGWRDIKVVWFDAAQCGTSEVRPPKQSGSYTVTSRRWTPNFNGLILGVGGHMHDGGVDLQIWANPGKQMCNSVAKYSEKDEYKSKMAAGGHAHGGAKDHISSMSICYLGEMPQREIAAGQGSWYVTGRYDYSKWAGMLEKGKQSEVMVIALMYTAVAPGVRPVTAGGAAIAAPKAKGKGKLGAKAV